MPKASNIVGAADYEDDRGGTGLLHQLKRTCGFDGKNVDETNLRKRKRARAARRKQPVSSYTSVSVVHWLVSDRASDARGANALMIDRFNAALQPAYEIPCALHIAHDGSQSAVNAIGGAKGMSRSSNNSKFALALEHGSRVLRQVHGDLSDYGYTGTKCPKMEETRWGCQAQLCAFLCAVRATLLPAAKRLLTAEYAKRDKPKAQQCTDDVSRAAPASLKVLTWFLPAYEGGWFMVRALIVAKAGRLWLRGAPTDPFRFRALLHFFETHRGQRAFEMHEELLYIQRQLTLAQREPATVFSEAIKFAFECGGSSFVEPTKALGSMFVEALAEYVIFSVPSPRLLHPPALTHSSRAASSPTVCSYMFRDNSGRGNGNRAPNYFVYFEPPLLFAALGSQSESGEVTPSHRRLRIDTAYRLLHCKALRVSAEREDILLLYTVHLDALKRVACDGYVGSALGAALARVFGALSPGNHWAEEFVKFGNSGRPHPNMFPNTLNASFRENMAEMDHVLSVGDLAAARSYVAQQAARYRAQ